MTATITLFSLSLSSFLWFSSLFFSVFLVQRRCCVKHLQDGLWSVFFCFFKRDVVYFGIMRWSACCGDLIRFSFFLLLLLKYYYYQHVSTFDLFSGSSVSTDGSVAFFFNVWNNLFCLLQTKFASIAVDIVAAASVKAPSHNSLVPASVILHELVELLTAICFNLLQSLLLLQVWSRYCNSLPAVPVSVVVQQACWSWFLVDLSSLPFVDSPSFFVENRSCD